MLWSFSAKLSPCLETSVGVFGHIAWYKQRNRVNIVLMSQTLSSEDPQGADFGTPIHGVSPVDPFGDTDRQYLRADLLMQLGTPNLPGMTVNREKWVFMSKNGFKRRSADRPGTAGANGFRGTGSMKNLGTASPASRPKSAGGMRLDKTGDVGIGQRRATPNGRVLGVSAGSRQTVGLAGNTGKGSLPALASPPHSPTAKTDTFEPKWTSSVLRFYGYFEIQRAWSNFAPIGSPTLEDNIVRPVTVYHFLEDGTTEIKETTDKNSGMGGGLFYRRGFLERDDDFEGAPVTPTDMRVGKSLFVVGRELHMCDADIFTRQWYVDNVQVELEEAIAVPGGYRSDLGAQFATGLVSLTGPGTAPRGRKSANYEDKAKVRDAAYNFMNFSESILHFKCCQLDRDLPSHERMTRQVLSQSRMFLLNYYRGTSQTEIAYIKTEESLRDEPALLLKKTLLEKNWKEVKKGRHPIHYGPQDFLVGNIVDVYGRHLLIVDCDEGTRKYYQEDMGIKQSSIDVRSIPKPAIVHPVPGRKDGFLTIGSDKDTLATVYGHPKPTIDIDKMQRNSGRSLKCVVQKLDAEGRNANEFGVTYLMTYHLEDDSVSIYMNVARNCGLKGGTFLNRGEYMNALPFDSPTPRKFIPQDIYLGNVVCINGHEMRIIEMDSMSVAFCEAYPDEFPLFDTFTVMRAVLNKIVQRSVNLRTALQATDPEMTGFIRKETFFACLDGLGLMGDLMDQEVMTLLRRFADSGLYHYNELCDFLAHLYSITHRSTPPSNEKDLFLYTMRRKQTQWRRVFRTDRTSSNGFISLDRMFKQMSKHLVKGNKKHRAMIRALYAVPHGTPGTEGVKLPSNKKDGKNSSSTKAAWQDTAGSSAARRFSTASQMANTGTGLRASGGSVATVTSTLNEMSVSGQSLATVDTMASMPISPIAVRREHLAKSVFPRQAKVDVELLERVKNEHEEKSIIIDYNSFCTDIYTLGWLEAGDNTG